MGPVKIGNPYRINGRTYYPKDDRDYRETGKASWYGPNFHGKPTANGERFDQNALTAAHRTLPMPSWVHVENLDNGREITVRVNDRGPFAHGRIIDLSRRSAQLLDMQRAGVARVRVTRVYPEKEARVAAAMPPDTPQIAGRSVPEPGRPGAKSDVMTPATSGAATGQSVTSVAVPVPSPAPHQRPRQLSPLARGDAIFIQIAAVSGPARANKLKEQLGRVKALGPILLQPAGSGLTRVRVGPFSILQDAQTTLAKLREAGYEDARIMTGPIS